MAGFENSAPHGLLSLKRPGDARGSARSCCPVSRALDIDSVPIRSACGSGVRDLQARPESREITLERAVSLGTRNPGCQDQQADNIVD